MLFVAVCAVEARPHGQDPVPRQSMPQDQRQARRQERGA